VAALPGVGLLAHGGVAGAVAEALVVLAVAGVLVAVWLRERAGKGELEEPRASELTDHDSE